MAEPVTPTLSSPAAAPAAAAPAPPPALAAPFAALCREFGAAAVAAAVRSAHPTRLELGLARAEAPAAERLAIAMGWRPLRTPRTMPLAVVFAAPDPQTGHLLQLVLRFEAAPTGAAVVPRPAAAKPLRATPLGGGLCIAFVGCDGAGKSTVVQRLVDWLGPVFCVERVYLGSGQGTCSWLRWPLLVAHRWLARPRPARPPAVADPATPPRRGWRARLRPIWALTLALEKRQKLRAVYRARAAGAIVVSDRWPQNEIAGFNDGPLLTAWADHRWWLLRALARWERRPYDQAAQQPPDLVVKLLVSRDVALARKPDMMAAEIARRTAAVQALQFGARTRILSVLADAPLAEVVQQVQAGVWEVL